MMSISMKFPGRSHGLLWALIVLASILGSLFLIALPARAIGTADTWSQLGPIQAGKASAAEASPLFSFDKNVFFATDSAGVFRSVDGGSTFVESNTGLTDHRVKHLVVSPRFNTDSTIFASTPSGLFKSADASGSWTKVAGGLPNVEITAVVYSPNFSTDDTLYASALGFGLYASANGGVTWTLLSTSGMTDLGLTGVQVVEGNFGSLIIVVRTSTKIFRSDDSGATWAERINGLPSGVKIITLRLTPDFRTSNIGLVGTKANGIYRTTNGGTNWSSIGLSGDGPANVFTFSSDYASDNVVFAGTTTGGFYKSTDNGATFTQKITGLDRKNITAISTSNDFRVDRTVFAGGGQGGVFKTSDAGESWVEVGSGINTGRAEAIDFSNDYSNDSTIFVATQAGIFRSSDKGTTWTRLLFNAPLEPAVSLAVSSNYSNDGHVLIGLKDSGYYRTFVGAGNSWVTQNLGLDTPITNAPNVLALSPNFGTDLTAFVGGPGGIYRTTQSGAQWSLVSSGAIFADISSLAISPSFASDTTVFAGTRGAGLYLSTTNGQSWTAVNAGLGSFMIRQVSISPTFATDRTALAATDSGVFISSDGGTSWSATSLTVDSSAVVFASGSQAFAATSGVNSVVHQSVDGGRTWVATGTGLPASEIVSLAISPDFSSDKNVFAGTGGRGVWVYQAGQAVAAATATPTSSVSVPTVATTTITSATVTKNLYVTDPTGLNASLKHNVPNLNVLVDGQLRSANFRDHFEDTGGVERWGLPTSEVIEENTGSLTQYYQRGVVDFHRRDDLGGIWLIERRLAWDFVGGGLGGSVDQGVEPQITNTHEGVIIEWGHKISDFDVTGTDVGFRRFFDRLGGTKSFGYPKTDAREDTGGLGMLMAPAVDVGWIRQYFQAAVFEYHPEAPEGYKVQLSLLGDTLRNQNYPDNGWATLTPFQAATELTDGSTFTVVAISD